MNEETKVLANIEAEQSALSAVFVKPACLPEIAQHIKADDFYRETHRIVFRAMQTLQREQVPIDLVTMTEYLKKNNSLDKIGGLPFLTQITQKVPTAANVMTYVKIVKDKAQRRALIDKAREISQAAYDENTDIAETITKAQEELTTAMARDERAELHPMNEVMVEYYNLLHARARGENLGIKTGYNEFDKLTGRLQGGSVYVIAARPAMGKSALALNIAANVCKQGYYVLYHSLEMPRAQLIDRLTAFTAMVSVQTLKNIKETGMSAVWNRLAIASVKMANYHIEIDDRGYLSYSDIASKAIAMKAHNVLDLLIIDHVQIMRADKSKRYMSRANELDDITGQLKELAMRLNIPIILLSQLSRANESRDNKRPTLSDLRDSGGIEQNADVVAGLYREGYYEHNNEDRRAELIILKSRDGQTGTAHLEWYGAYTKFSDSVKPQGQHRDNR